MGDYAIAVLREKEHLAGPRFRRQRPAVAEDNRLSGAPILVVDLCSVLGRYCAHFGISFVVTANLSGARSFPTGCSSVRALGHEGTRTYSGETARREWRND